MHIGKKAAFLSAVAGALVLGAGGAASACATHPHHPAPGGSTQHNECSTSTGTIADTVLTAPTGDVSFGSNCINLDGTGQAHQTNECDTSAGTTAVTSGLAPTGEIEVSSNCANIAY
ncbi:hypothetical protein [Kitasatospora sp. NPDC050543]|uniref:hypothetical protein n=1 Tax=Kitasatospora sp. NPDC050543 TaxID=3364054 RepID=UPI0037BCF9B5